MTEPTLPAPINPDTSPFDTLRKTRADGTEYWSARDLMTGLGYERWENFERVLTEARRAADIVAAHDQFRDVTKMITVGKGGSRAVTDVELTRYACYMVAMSADGTKPEVAAAKTYFAIRTREAETATPIAAPTPPAPINAPLSAKEQMEVLALAKGLISDDYLETPRYRSPPIQRLSDLALAAHTGHGQSA